MFNALAVPEIVGFVGFPLAAASFLAASVNVFISASLVSGFLASIPDIYRVLRVQCVTHVLFKSVGRAR